MVIYGSPFASQDPYGCLTLIDSTSPRAGVVVGNFLSKLFEEIARWCTLSSPQAEIQSLEFMPSKKYERRVFPEKPHIRLICLKPPAEKRSSHAGSRFGIRTWTGRVKLAVFLKAQIRTLFAIGPASLD